MKKTANPEFVYLVGTGGIGMSALARWFMQAGVQVAGYDKTTGNITQNLEKDGMPIVYEDRPDLIPTDFLLTENISKTLVIYTPAVPADLGILNYFKENEYQIKKRSEVLGLLSEQHKTLAVAGTHGKTTTTACLAHILKYCGNNCTAFIGGIAKNYNSNILIGNSGVMVAEADEFDKSFLKLSPTGAIITSVEADHLDIYGNGAELENSFRDFANKVKNNGSLVVNQKYSHHFSGLKRHIITYSANEQADYYAKDIKAEMTGINFIFVFKDGMEIPVHMPVYGVHNIENAIGAGALACESGFEPSDICKALMSFTGVVRRFDIRLSTEKVLVIDDYAHHPDELNALAKSIKLHFPDLKSTIVFQPHLYSRTRDFADGFISALSEFDQVCLLEIYPAREKPITGINSKMLLEKITSKPKALSSREKVINFLNKYPSNIVITAGAGDIETLVPELIQQIKEKNE